MAALLANSLLDLADAPEVFFICLGLRQEADGLRTQDCWQYQTVNS
jgi:hypothetical protein